MLVNPSVDDALHSYEKVRFRGGIGLRRAKASGGKGWSRMVWEWDYREEQSEHSLIR